MTENPGTRAGLNVGDRVKVHSDTTAEFVIVSIDGEDAVIESVRDDVPVVSPSMPALSGWFRSSPDPDKKCHLNS